MNEVTDISPNLNIIYRELGQIEGRVQALEDTTREIKALLGTINSQLSAIQISVSTAIGTKQGNKEAYGSVGYLVNFIISAITAAAIVHYGR